MKEYELGSYKPYYKFASYPVTVTCDFELISTTGDFEFVYINFFLSIRLLALI